MAYKNKQIAQTYSRAGHARINARGDCVDLADAGSGRGNENPPGFSRGECQIK